MNYVLLNDNCSDCHFVSNAFTLLQLPKSDFNISEKSLSTFKLPPNAVLLLCKNTEAKHKEFIQKQASKKKASFILFGCEHSYTNTAIQQLKMPFNIYEIKDALSNSYDYCHIAADTNIATIINPHLDKIIGKSNSISIIKKLIQQVACMDSTVLIQGQSGTGKDVIANCIHQMSNRSKHPFVPINCGAIPAELIESELFGYEKGAFTGAATRRAGRFEMAQGGTLFLDEIGEMPLNMQVKLLRVLQERKIERIGGNTTIDVDIRIIAATNKNLESLIQKNQFREDLFYRLNVFPIHSPSLHERQEDIPILIDHFIEKIYERIQHKTFFTENAKKILCNYNWPGNIRELQNFLERMVILYPEGIINEEILGTYIHLKTEQLSFETDLLPQ